jgi:hypothetical protein
MSFMILVQNEPEAWASTPVAARQFPLCGQNRRRMKKAKNSMFFYNCNVRLMTYGLGKSLQHYGAGEKSHEQSALVAGNSPYGKFH